MVNNNIAETLTVTLFTRLIRTPAHPKRVTLPSTLQSRSSPRRRHFSIPPTTIHSSPSNRSKLRPFPGPCFDTARRNIRTTRGRKAQACRRPLQNHPLLPLGGGCFHLAKWTIARSCTRRTRTKSTRRWGRQQTTPSHIWIPSSAGICYLDFRIVHCRSLPFDEGLAADVWSSCFDSF